MDDFKQHEEWDEALASAWEELLRLAVREDLDRWHDWTTAALVSPGLRGSAAVVARRPGVAAGLPAAPRTLEEYDPDLTWTARVGDGEPLARGQIVGIVDGPARSLLTAERVLLNLLSRLSGIATMTRAYVDAVAETKARIYDTRKTTPGWRLLEKYAVRQGGGCNHRTGLHDAILIKDNHLALRGIEHRGGPAEAVQAAREFVASISPAPLIVEVEVDDLPQLAEALDSSPEIVLLDNFSLADLREAVRMRNARSAGTILEASGGVNLETVRSIAETGVERISVGALTHSAPWLDLALDWNLDAR